MPSAPVRDPKKPSAAHPANFRAHVVCPLRFRHTQTPFQSLGFAIAGVRRAGWHADSPGWHRQRCRAVHLRCLRLELTDAARCTQRDGADSVERRGDGASISLHLARASPKRRLRAQHAPLLGRERVHRGGRRTRRFAHLVAGHLRHPAARLLCAGRCAVCQLCVSGGRLQRRSCRAIRRPQRVVRAGAALCVRRPRARRALCQHQEERPNATGTIAAPTALVTLACSAGGRGSLFYDRFGYLWSC
mmetsp:Transcript_2394/g.7175  ORF Transcript_2394/g.7175 Transcript_2394/m.7175 type:complete len:246 (+) Transcript_2394:708-1445(+)